MAESRGGLDPALSDAIARLTACLRTPAAGPAAADDPAPGDRPVHVMAARNWLYPLERQRVVYQTSRTRPCTVLEEFIHKAACLPEAAAAPVEIALVADLLGLDRLFIEHTASDLSARGLLIKEALPALRLTRAGEAAFAGGRIVDEGETGTLTYCFDRKFGVIYAEAVPDNQTGVFPTDPFPALELLDRTVANRTGYVDRSFVLQAGAVLGQTLEPAGSDQRVTSIVSATVVEPVQTLMSEIWTWDEQSDRLDCHVWDHARAAPAAELAAFIRHTPGAADLQVRRSPDGGLPGVRWRS